jgi:hypothetical protein
MEVSEIIADIEKGFYYSFTIKPEDEDEQSYFRPKPRSNKWGVLSFCLLAQIKTDRLINRLKTRVNPVVVSSDKNKALFKEA